MFVTLAIKRRNKFPDFSYQNRCYRICSLVITRGRHIHTVPRMSHVVPDGITKRKPTVELAIADVLPSRLTGHVPPRRASGDLSRTRPAVSPSMT